MTVPEPVQKPKSPAPSTGWDALSAICLAISMTLFMLTPGNSLLHDLGIVTLGIGAVCRSLKSYALLPCLLLLAGSLVGAATGYRLSARPLMLSLSGGAALWLAYGWWKERQAKALAKRQTYRP